MKIVKLTLLIFLMIALFITEGCAPAPITTTITNTTTVTNPPATITHTQQASTVTSTITITDIKTVTITPTFTTTDLSSTTTQISTTIPSSITIEVNETTGQVMLRDTSTVLYTDKVIVNGTLVFDYVPTLSITYLIKIEAYDASGTKIGASKDKIYTLFGQTPQEFSIECPVDNGSQVSKCIINCSKF